MFGGGSKTWPTDDHAALDGFARQRESEQVETVVVSSLDVVQAHTGHGLGPELVTALTNMPLAQIDALTEELLTDAPKPVGMPPANEVWPLVNLRASTFAPGGSSSTYASSGSAGLRLADSIDLRRAGTGQFSNSVLRALLYCHGLVIEDPLLLGADLYRGTSGETKAVARQAVVAGAISLVEIAPLLDSGVVETFFTGSTARDEAAAIADLIREGVDLPGSHFDEADVWEAFEADYVDGLHPDLQEVWRRVRGGDRSPPLEHIEAAVRSDREMTEIFVRVLSELRPRSVVENAIEVVALAVADTHLLGDRHDLLCPTALFARLLFSGSSDPLHDRRVHELVRITVPNIEQLLVEDAVMIRSDSEAFSNWRARLSMSLDHARQLKIEVGEEVDTASIVGEDIAEARRALFQELGDSSTLGRRLRGGLGFVAGALGGALGGAAGGTSGAVLGAAGGAIPWLASQAIHVVPPAYLRRHYLVFERPDRGST
jgi:hypothetical protein